MRAVVTIFATHMPEPASKIPRPSRNFPDRDGISAAQGVAATASGDTDATTED
jgi:hypothetical protein